MSKRFFHNIRYIIVYVWLYYRRQRFMNRECTSGRSRLYTRALLFAQLCRFLRHVCTVLHPAYVLPDWTRLELRTEFKKKNKNKRGLFGVKDWINNNKKKNEVRSHWKISFRFNRSDRQRDISYFCAFGAGNYEGRTRLRTILLLQLILLSDSYCVRK